MEDRDMELHVLGPAFGLPSIDAECIATVALLQLQLDGGWTIVPDQDQSRHLPYLKAGDRTIEGFKNIERHISDRQHGGISELEAKQQADATALSSFILSNAQTLLDISLYVSFENYTTTRSAFTKILPWYSNYMIPPARRKAARTRTDHLGVSSIDVDDVHEDLSNRPPGFEEVGKEKSFEPEAQKRASLLLPQRNTLSSLLRRPEHSAVFKLHALADNFFEPLQDMLGESDYFLERDNMSAVDCLAYGYLSLMYYPEMPQNWLKRTMRKKYGKLVSYVERMHQHLAVATKAEDVMALADCKHGQDVAAKRHELGIALPWSPPATASIINVTSTIAYNLFSRIPYLGPPTQIINSPPTKRSFLEQCLPILLATTAATIGLSGYYAFTTGLLTWPRGQEVQIIGKKRLTDYRHLGAALAGMSMFRRSAGHGGMFQDEPRTMPIEGIEVEEDRVP